MERVAAQASFTDLSVADLGGPRALEFFAVCEQAIPFAELAASIADIFQDSPQGGAPHWPVVTLLKIVFLQKSFGLSDPMAEEMLRDRISFRRFVGLSFDDATPDYSTIWRFRERLKAHGHGSTLFEKSLEILRAKGLVMNQGTLIDAVIIQAPRGRVRQDGSSTADACISKTVKQGRVYTGYRSHIATDRRGLITDFVYDTASVSEHTHFDRLAAPEKRAVFADSGCRSQQRIAALRSRGVVAAICHRRVKGQKELTAVQKRFNRIVAGFRAFVEHPFAWIKRAGGGTTRYRGITRNALDFALHAMTYNFRRSLTLKPVF